MLTPTPIFSAEVLKKGRVVPLSTLRALVAYKARIFAFPPTPYHLDTAAVIF